MGSAAPEETRISYIDFLKGIACLIMLMAHAMRVDLGDVDYPTKVILAMQPPGAQMFFFASGMNIILLLERYRDRPRFNLTAYYLWAAVLLFFLGYTYSYARLAMNTWQIFQGIAAATAVTYLLVRSRLGDRPLILLSVLLYLIYVRFRLNMEPVLMWFRNTLPVGASPGNTESLVALKTLTASLKPTQRWLFVNFSLLPWVCYTLLGAVAFRNVRRRPEYQKWWAAAFAALFGLGMAAIWLPDGVQYNYWHADIVTDALFRHVPYHAFTAIGSVGLVWLACHRWYRGARGTRGKIRRVVFGYIEFFGAASFVFFCFHWLCLIGMNQAWAWMASQGWVAATMNIHLRWIVAYVLVLPLMVPATALGVRWARRRYAVREQAWLWVLCLLLSIWLHREHHHIAATAAAFAACVDIAYLYGMLRAAIKDHYSRLEKTARRPAGAVAR